MSSIIERIKALESRISKIEKSLGIVNTKTARASNEGTCHVILSKYSKNSGKICGRKLPCDKHSGLSIEELMKLRVKKEEVRDNIEEEEEVEEEVKEEVEDEVKEEKRKELRKETIVIVGFKHQHTNANILKLGKITFEKDPMNPYSKNTVNVMVDGELVGHVSNDNNENFPSNIVYAESIADFKGSAKVEIYFEDNEENKTYENQKTHTHFHGSGIGVQSSYSLYVKEHWEDAEGGDDFGEKTKDLARSWREGGKVDGEYHPDEDAYDF